jgi:predicted transcriptional regulator
MTMPGSEKRNEDGQFRAEHEIRPEDVFDAMDSLEPYTTRELADTLDVPRRTVYNYLNELAKSGRIRKKKTEPRRAIWIRED